MSRATRIRRTFISVAPSDLVAFHQIPKGPENKTILIQFPSYDEESLTFWGGQSSVSLPSPGDLQKRGTLVTVHPSAIGPDRGQDRETPAGALLNREPTEGCNRRPDPVSAGGERTLPTEAAAFAGPGGGNLAFPPSPEPSLNIALRNSRINRVKPVRRDGKMRKMRGKTAEIRARRSAPGPAYRHPARPSSPPESGACQ